MNPKRLLGSMIGVIPSTLGCLWFLQGTALIQLEPIYCVAECEPITSTSLPWAIIGAVTFFIGLFLLAKSLRQKDN